MPILFLKNEAWDMHSYQKKSHLNVKMGFKGARGGKSYFASIFLTAINSVSTSSFKHTYT